MSGLRRAAREPGRPLGRRGRLLFTADHPGAAAFAAGVLFIPRGSRGRALVRSARWLPRGLHAALVARLPGMHGEPDRRPPILSAREFMARDGADWPGWVALEDPPTADRGRLVLFVFQAGDRDPTAILKLRASGAPGGRLKREWQALRGLQMLPPDLAAHVPRPLGFVQTEGVEALWTTVLPGRSLDVAMQTGLDPCQSRRHLLDAAAWLGRFHAVTQRTRRWVPDTAVVTRALRRLEAADLAAGRRNPDALVLQARGALVAAGHGDFWPRNLLVGGGARICVVDWEHARASAPCFQDLCHLLLTWSQRGRSSGPADPLLDFRRAFVDAGHVSEAVAEAGHAYGNAAGISSDRLPAMLRLFVLTSAAHAHAPASDAPDPWAACAALLPSARIPWRMP